MAKKKGRDRHSLPPCPDPDLYQMIETKEGCFWRRKRGTVTEAVLNRKFANNTSTVSICSPAASRVVQRLRDFTKELSMGRVTARISGKFTKTFNNRKTLDYSLLRGFDFQPEKTIDKILGTLFSITINQYEESIAIHIPVREDTVTKLNGIVTDYYFEGILLYGDPLKERSLNVEYTVSKPYQFDVKKISEECVLSLPLTAEMTPWMLLLKVSCLEGNEMAANSRHYGMRVLEVGG